MEATSLTLADTDCFERTPSREAELGRKDAPGAQGPAPASIDQADSLRAALAESIERVKRERDEIRAARDSIPRLQKRFNSEGHKLWQQLDDWLNGLDAALADAPETMR